MSEIRRGRLLFFADRSGIMLIGAGLGYLCMRDLHYAVIIAWAFLFVGAVARIVVSDMAEKGKVALVCVGCNGDVGCARERGRKSGYYETGTKRMKLQQRLNEETGRVLNAISQIYDWLEHNKTPPTKD